MTEKSKGNSRTMITKIIKPICRICYSLQNPSHLFQPCSCVGSIGWLHLQCLLKWVEIRQSNICQICNCSFEIDNYDPLQGYKYYRFSKNQFSEYFINHPAQIIALGFFSLLGFIVLTQFINAVQNYFLSLTAIINIFCIGFMIFGFIYLWIKLRISQNQRRRTPNNPQKDRIETLRNTNYLLEKFRNFRKLKKQWNYKFL